MMGLSESIRPAVTTRPICDDDHLQRPGKKYYRRIDELLSRHGA